MSEISEAAKLKACELMLAEPHSLTAFARYIQQVSDAAKAVRRAQGAHTVSSFIKSLVAPFILPDPVDPLDECIREAIHDCGGSYLGTGYDIALRRALAKRGLKIVEAQS